MFNGSPGSKEICLCEFFFINYKSVKSHLSRLNTISLKNLLNEKEKFTLLTFNFIQESNTATFKKRPSKTL